MSEEAVTVEQVREAQESFKNGYNLHQEQQYKEAIEAFKQATSINQPDEGHLPELSKKLKAMSVKLIQESIAYMGCAAIHLQHLVDQLSEDEQAQVPVDDNLKKQFGEWNSQ